MKSSRVIMVANREMLMVFLQTNYPETKRTAIKQLLRHKAVYVNGNPVTRPNHMLEAGDRVVVERGQPVPEKRKIKGLMPEIVYEDRHIIVVDKPEGLLTIATDKETIRTAYRQITSYVQEDRPHRGERIFIVHRLDRETSGLLVFARTEEAKQILQENWEDADKKYYAIVEGLPRVREGKIRSHLREHPKSLRMHSAPPSEDAKLAVTKYRVIEESRHFALLDITLETGRKNQIRAHLSELGHPVVGDKKYDAHTNPIKRLALHAYYLSFPHPVTGKRLTFKTETPEEFTALLEEKKGPIIRSIANRGERPVSRHTVEPLTKADERREKRESRYPRTPRHMGRPFARRGPDQEFHSNKDGGFDDFGSDDFDDAPDEERRSAAPQGKPAGEGRRIANDFERSRGARDERGPRRDSDRGRDDRGPRRDFDRPRRDSAPAGRGERDARGPRRDFDRDRDARGPRDERDARGPRRDSNRGRDDRGPRRDFDRPRRDSAPAGRGERDARGPRRDFDRDRDARGPRDERDARGPRRDSDRGRDDRGPRRDFDRPRRDSAPAGRGERDARGPRGDERDRDRGERDTRGSGRSSRSEREPRPRHDVPKQFRGRRADGLPRPDERPRDRDRRDDRPARGGDEREPRRDDRRGPPNASDRPRPAGGRPEGRPQSRGGGAPGKGRKPQRAGGRPGGKPPRRGR